MLAAFYRFAVVNQSGLTLTAANVTVSFRPWKTDAQGQLVYGNARSLNPTGNIASGAVGVTQTQDNTSDLFLGLAGHFSAETNSGTLGTNPHVVLLLQTSPDGASWPDDGEGTVLAVAGISAAGAPEQRDFEV